MLIYKFKDSTQLHLQQTAGIIFLSKVSMTDIFLHKHERKLQSGEHLEPICLFVCFSLWKNLHNVYIFFFMNRAVFWRWGGYEQTITTKGILGIHFLRLISVSWLLDCVCLRACFITYLPRCFPIFVYFFLLFYLFFFFSLASLLISLFGPVVGHLLASLQTHFVCFFPYLHLPCILTCLCASLPS